MKTLSAFGATWPLVSLLSLALLPSCGGGAPSSSEAADYPGKDLGMPPVAPGFVRYVTKPMTVAAGQDILLEEWVAPPLSSEMDAVAVTGAQSQGGHHANLYATTDIQPVGTARAWQDADQLSAKTLGGIGGEGNSSLPLPPGVVFRVAKGSALAIQVHYINATAKPLVGRSALDVKLAPVDPSAQVASLLAAVTNKVSLPPLVRTTTDFSCPVPKDFRVLAYANHMHNWGVSASTELINADGTTTPLKVDPVWDPSWAFDPDYTKFTLQAPRVIPAGSTLHTTCTWENMSTTTVNFPDEMCIFGAIYLGDKDATCADGTWPQ